MTSEELRGLVVAISQDAEDHLRRGAATAESRSIIHLHEHLRKLANHVSDLQAELLKLKANASKR